MAVLHFCHEGMIDEFRGVTNWQMNSMRGMCGSCGKEILVLGKMRPYPGGEYMQKHLDKVFFNMRTILNTSRSNFFTKKRTPPEIFSYGTRASILRHLTFLMG